MRILWVSHFLLYPDTGYGALQRSRNLLKELSKYHEVYLICLYRDVDKLLAPDLKMVDQDLKKYCKNIYFVPHTISKLNKSYLLAKSIIYGIPFSAYIYNSKLLNKYIFKCLLENEIDIIYSDTIGMLELLLDKIHAKKALTHHDIESHKMYRRYMSEYSFLKKLFFKFEYKNIIKYEQLYCSKYHINFVVSELDQERLRSLIQNVNTYVIENGVDCEYFKYYPRINNSKELIFAGALDYYPNTKGLYNFCDNVWPLLKEKYSNLRMNIIGKSPSKELIEHINSKKDISLVGYVEDIRIYIKKASVFICPIEEGGGTRIKILDAFSQGIPVVSTKIGAEGLHVENGIHLLFAESKAEYVENISKLLENIEFANQVGRNARGLVEKYYSFKNIGEKFADVFNKI